jgi:formylmethanofuran dehydrogenase subunit E
VSYGLTIDEASRFHGHLGPWLVIGYRAGQIARDRLKPSDFHDLRCIVKVPCKIPFSCSIDGVQASACCTLGKGNITIEDKEDFEFIFTNSETGETLKLRLKREVLSKLSSFKSTDEAVSYVKALREWELFELG